MSSTYQLNFKIKTHYVIVLFWNKLHTISPFSSKNINDQTISIQQTEELGVDAFSISQIIHISSSRFRDIFNSRAGYIEVHLSKPFVRKQSFVTVTDKHHRQFILSAPCRYSAWSAYFHFVHVIRCSLVLFIGYLSGSRARADCRDRFWDFWLQIHELNAAIFQIFRENTNIILNIYGCNNVCD